MLYLNKNVSVHNPSISTFIFQTISIILTNSVPIYGVIYLGWNSFNLVLLFILEGLIVLLTDSIKVRFFKETKKLKSNLVFEICFILFFGLFAILVYGPYESLENLVLDKMVLVKDVAVVELGKPLIIIAVIRLIRLVRELLKSSTRDSHGKHLPDLEGGRWALLLFFAVIAAPLFAKAGPNPFGGLLVLVLFKTFGEILFVWLAQVKFKKRNNLLFRNYRAGE